MCLFLRCLLASKATGAHPLNQIVAIPKFTVRGILNSENNFLNCNNGRFLYHTTSTCFQHCLSSLSYENLKNKNLLNLFEGQEIPNKHLKGKREPSVDK